MNFIGTDIVPIIRIEKIIQEKGTHFLNHIFTKLEQNICDGKNSPANSPCPVMCNQLQYICCVGGL